MPSNHYLNNQLNHCLRVCHHHVFRAVCSDLSWL